MPEVQEKLHDVQDKISSGSGNTALKAAAAAAATTAATYAVRRALANDHGDGEDRSQDGGSSNGSRSKKGGSSGILASAAATSWDAAADVLLPMADEAAEAAGKYVATHGPEILRERIVPKFIEAFNDAT
jgi:hypothetical protein